MANIPIYTVDATSNLVEGNAFYVNTGNNIKQINLKNASLSLYKSMKLYAHSGNNLGTSYTSAQQTAVANGTFNGLNIGDYWVIGGHNWRIWDIDWYLNKGDQQCTSHHLVIIPDDCILKADGGSTHWMHATDTTASGYKGTDYRNTHRATCEATIKNCFGDHILKHRELISTASSGGASSAWEWNDATVELPSEVMMYGSVVWGKGSYNTGTAYPQLALARLDPSRVVNRENYWLRDVASASSFAYVTGHGHAYSFAASRYWISVRPLFLLH